MEEAPAQRTAGASKGFYPHDGWVEPNWRVRRKSALGRLAPIDHLSDPRGYVGIEPNLISRPAAFSEG
jgi:hypothetical protein